MTLQKLPVRLLEGILPVMIQVSGRYAEPPPIEVGGGMTSSSSLDASNCCVRPAISQPGISAECSPAFGWQPPITKPAPSLARNVPVQVDRPDPPDSASHLENVRCNRDQFARINRGM